MRNKNVAALLAIFFGGFGVHKFYLRDPGSGIFYIMLSIFSASLKFPIASILGWIDAFSLFTMSEERFNKKYNNNPISRQRRRQQRTQTRQTRRNPYEQSRQTVDRRASNAPISNPYENKRRRIIKDNPFKNSGLKRLKEFDLDLAEVDLKRALEIESRDKDVHFALAKLYSMEEKTDLSYFHLKEAIDNGFSNMELIKTDESFAFIRVQDSFESFARSGFQRIPANVEKSQVSQKPQVTQAIDPPKDDLLQDDVLLSQLNKLKELRNKGLLSEREFNEEKVKLMGR